jgi:glycosyltransferase involved in cell wall biosynthesis
VRLLILAKHYLPYYSALSVRLSNMARRFCQKDKDIEIRIVVFDPDGPEFGESDGSEERIEVRRYSRGFFPASLLQPQSLNPLLLVWWAKIILGEIDDFHPDVVMATTPPFVPVTAYYLAARISGRRSPYVVEYRDDLSSYIDNIAGHKRFYAKYPLKVANLLMSSLLFDCIRNASLVSVVNETLQRQLLRKNPKVILVPNGINAEEIAEVAAGFNREAVLRKNGIDDRDSKVVAYIGDLNWPYYMPEVILEPIKKLKDQGLEISYAVVGDGSRREILERRSREMGLDSSVYLLGRKDHRDAIELLMASDVAFYTLAKGDAQSNHAISTKIYEYMGCNLPILAVSDRGSAISELIESKSLGISLGWDELERMEISLIDLLQSRTYKENLEANHAYILDRYDRNRGIDLLYEKLMEILEERQT